LIPTGLILWNLKGKLRGVAKQIVESLGNIIGEDQSNSDSNDPRFCMENSLEWAGNPSVVVPIEHQIKM
jgi:hypothetical protein